MGDIPSFPLGSMEYAEPDRAPLARAEDLALANINKLYRRAHAGDTRAASHIRVISGYELSPVLSRMASMLLEDLGRRDRPTLAEAAGLPCEINHDDGLEEV